MHLSFGLALGLESVLRLLRPSAVAVVPVTRPPVRFTLVNTPDSAATDTPPQDSRFLSNRHTRAQDHTPETNTPGEDQPRIDTSGKSHNVRPDARAPVLALVPAPPERAAPAVGEPAPAQSQRRVTAPPLMALRPPPAIPAKPRLAPDQPPVSLASPVKTPAPAVVPLPKKDVTQARREIARLQREIAALRDAPEVQPGRITMSQAAAAEVANARVRGEFSYGATQHFFGEYLLRMKERVEREWFSRLLTEYSRAVSNRVVIDFKVYSNGDVGNMQFVEQHGDPYFPVLCWNAIEAAGPFGLVPYAEVEGIPPDLANKPLNIRFTFHYN